eukprot:11659600-Heterocapsa_arctica.AAC.1
MLPALQESAPSSSASSSRTRSPPGRPEASSGEPRAAAGSSSAIENPSSNPSGTGCGKFVAGKKALDDLRVVAASRRLRCL